MPYVSFLLAVIHKFSMFTSSPKPVVSPLVWFGAEKSDSEVEFDNPLTSDPFRAMNQDIIFASKKEAGPGLKVKLGTATQSEKICQELFA